jgi:hypothetical protein
MTSPAQFIYKGHRVEIVPPDTRRLIGTISKSRSSGVLQRDLLFSSLRAAADRRRNKSDAQVDMVALLFLVELLGALLCLY